MSADTDLDPLARVTAASVSVSDCYVEPSSGPVAPDEQITIGGFLTNDGDQSETGRVYFMVNGDVVDSQDATVSTFASTPVSTTFVPANLGYGAGDSMTCELEYDPPINVF